MLRLASILFIIITCLTVKTEQLSAQVVIPVYLQLNDQLTNKQLRYYPGMKLRYKTKEYPDTWRKQRIRGFIPEEDLIIFEEGYLKTSDIIAIRKPKGTWGQRIGITMMTVGVGVAFWGTVSPLADNSGEKFSFWPALIGGAVTGLGWLISKTGRRQKFTIGKHTQLRIMDIRFPEPSRT